MYVTIRESQFGRFDLHLPDVAEEIAIMAEAAPAPTKARTSCLVRLFTGTRRDASAAEFPRAA